MAELSLRTQMEQAAGRKELRRAIALEVLDKGVRELRRRFPFVYYDSSGLNWDEPEEVWRVKVRVQCATGESMDFTDRLLGFPNDRLIAEIALVV